LALGQQPVLGFQKSCADGVEVDVITDGAQVAVAAAFHQLGLVAAAEHMPRELVAAVEANSVGALQPGHAGDQVGVCSFQDQMIVIAHEAKRMHLPVRFLARFGQSLDEVIPINVV
jgi:hypothetical protein